MVERTFPRAGAGRTDPRIPVAKDDLMPHGPRLLAVLILVAALTVPASAQAPAFDLAPVQAQLRRGDYAGAEEALRARLRVEERDLAARILLGRTLIEAGKLKEAEEEAHKALDAAANDPDARALMAELHVLRGRYKLALPICREVLAATPDHLAARLTLTEALLQTGEYGEAELVLGHFFDFYNARVQAGTPLSADELVLVAQGVWWYGIRKGDKQSMKAAVPDLVDQALKLDPGNVDALLFGGSCYLSKHDHSHAQSGWFEPLLKQNPNHALGMLGMAGCFFSGNDRQKGQQALDRALQLNPNLREVQIAAARDVIRRRVYPDALKVLERALEINPYHPETLGLVAGCRYLTHDQAGFDEIVKRAHENNPKPAHFWYTLGDMFCDRMLLEEGQDWLKKAAELDPHHWDAITALGLNSLRLGYEEEAKSRLDLVTLKDPFNVWAINTWKLLSAYDTKFTVSRSENYIYRFHNSEVAFMEEYTRELAEDCWATLTKRYGFKPSRTVLLEMFPDHGDLSVRTFGLGGLGILGACFGHVIVLDSPKAQEVHGRFNWGSVLWHEMAHVWALQISKNRVPRWFTEGLSTYEEKLARPSWQREMEWQVFQAYHAGQLAPIMNMDQGDTGQGGDLINYYLYGSIIAEYLHTQHGFDKIIRILELYKEGKTTPEAFQTALGMDVPKVEANIRAYLKAYLDRVRLREPITRDREQSIAQQFQANPADPAALAGYARLMLEKDKLADAQEHAAAAIEKDPQSELAHWVMGQIWNRKRPPRLKKAIEYLSKAIDLGANDFGTHFTLARAYHQSKDLDSAVAEYLAARRCFERNVAKDNSPSAFLLEIYKEREEAEKYVRELEYIVAIDHDDFDKRMELATIYRQEGKKEKMIAMLEDAIYIEPRDLKLHAYLAEGYRETGQLDKAVREYRILIVLARKVNTEGKLDKRLADWYCDMAEIRLQQEKKDEAAQFVHEATKLIPTFPRAQELRAKLK